MIPLHSNPNPKDRLREMLRDKAILYSRDGHSIVDYQSRPMRWIYYQWAVSLLPEGAALLADALLAVLDTFQGRTIASIGMTGAPLIGALVARGGGRYTGLCIRKQREKHGTRRLIEGVADKQHPVVVVDDCIVSGGSLKAAISALEEEGYSVEGAVAVASFPYSGGIAWARSLGLRIETLFDVVNDLEAEWDSPTRAADTVASDSNVRVPAGLTPADAARWIAEYYLRDRQVPHPPEFLAGNFDSTGGLMVSFRERSTDRRIARNGFYRLDRADHSIEQDVVTATIKTLRSSEEAFARHTLDHLKVGVTFFGPHEQIEPDSLDFSRYGILASSPANPARHGGALPNTQFFTSEIEQFRHARFTNAALTQHEPFELRRHDVTKSIETGFTWPAFGVSNPSSPPDDRFGEAILRRVRAIASSSEETSDDSIVDAFPGDARRILGIAVSFYRQGMAGCWTSFGKSLDEMICDATRKAWQDERFARKEKTLSPRDCDIVVSAFYDCEKLGWVMADAAATKVRLGEDSLFASNPDADGFILAHIPVHYDWDKKAFARDVLRKGSMEPGPCWWTTYATKSWLGRDDRILPLKAGYPARQDTQTKAGHDCAYSALVRQVAQYIVRQIGPSELPSYAYHPILNDTTAAGSSVRILLALESLMDAADVLADPNLSAVANRGLYRLCQTISPSSEQPALRVAGADGVSADVALVSAVYRARERALLADKGVVALRRKLDCLFHADGVISPRDPGRRMKIDHDLFPGSALRMAARIAAVEGKQTLPRSLHASMDWYRRRFQLQHPWGMVWWQIQGWAALYALTGDPVSLPFVYEMADWALKHQLRTNGAFLVDYALDGPGFHTACVLEGIADAWYLAHSQSDEPRMMRYEESWRRGVKFLEQLICQPDDTFAMPEPAKCIGGVRAGLTTSYFRIDFAAHLLSALSKGIFVLRAKASEAERRAASGHLVRELS